MVFYVLIKKLKVIKVVKISISATAKSIVGIYVTTSYTASK